MGEQHLAHGLHSLSPPAGLSTRDYLDHLTLPPACGGLCVGVDAGIVYVRVCVCARARVGG